MLLALARDEGDSNEVDGSRKSTPIQFMFEWINWVMVLIMSRCHCSAVYDAAKSLGSEISKLAV